MNAIQTPATFSAEVQAIASRGLGDIRKSCDSQSARSLGDRFLGSVEGEATATDLEKLVAATTRRCASQRLATSSATSAHRVALTALAGGVGGPVGATLARLASQITSASYDSEDRRHMAGAWLSAIGQNGTAEEKVLAEAAAAVTGQRLAVSSATGAQKAAFDMLAGGVAGSREKVLADFGQRALRVAYDAEDRRAMAAEVLRRVVAQGSDRAADAVASTALAASGQRLAQSSAVATQTAALQMISAGVSGDLAQALATLGQKAASGSYDSEDARAQAGQVLGAIEKGAASPVASALAAAARGAAGARLAQSSAAGMQRKALEQLVAGVGQDTTEQAIARLGTAARKVAYDTEDARHMGDVLVREIETRTKDARIQAMVAYVHQYAGNGVSHSDAVKVQQDIFDGIVQGRLSVPAPPVKGASASGTLSGIRVSLPVVDEKADPADQERVLEESIAHNKDVANQVDVLAKRRAQDLAGIQPKVADLANRMSALADMEKPILARAKKLQTAFNAGLLVMAGGAIAGALGAPVTLGLVGVGVVTLVTSTIMRNRDAEKRAHLAGAYERLSFENRLLDIQSSAWQSEMDAAHAVGEQAEKAIRDAQGRLDVLRMARMAEAPSPEAPGSVAVEEDSVVIGNLRIPRKTVGPTA